MKQGEMQKSSTVVLDASAVLAFLQKEGGASVVTAAINDSVISTVNWSEVIKKLLTCDVDVGNMAEKMQSLGLRMLPFELIDSELAGAIYMITKESGLSLADRACLAVATKLDAPVYTTDREWLNVDLDLDIKLIR